MKKIMSAVIGIAAIIGLAACGNNVQEVQSSQSVKSSENEDLSEAMDDTEMKIVESTEKISEEIFSVEEGTEEYRGFQVDSILHTESDGDIHFNTYIPDNYDGSIPYALYITLPGYQGLYFQGVAQNIKTEEFGFEAQKYNDQMIIVAPQLSDWSETSARQTIVLTEFFLETYNIDSSKVYINGYSGGGETLSLVLADRPELYTAALMCSSQWDGSYDAVVEDRTPIYFVIGESDEYYGSEPFKKAYQELFKRYKEEGLSETEINEILILDVKGEQYFIDGGIPNQHGGGFLFSRDETIMGWLFSK